MAARAFIPIPLTYPIFKKKKQQLRTWDGYTPFDLERLSRRQEDHCELKASLSYAVSSRPCWKSCFEIKQLNKRKKRRSQQSWQGKQERGRGWREGGAGSAGYNSCQRWEWAWTQAIRSSGGTWWCLCSLQTLLPPHSTALAKTRGRIRPL